MVFEIAITRSMQRLRDGKFKLPLNCTEGSVLYYYICNQVGVNPDEGGLPIPQEVKNGFWYNKVSKNDYRSELVRYYLDKVNRQLYDEIIVHIPETLKSIY